MEEKQERDEFTQNSAHKEKELKPSREKLGVVCALGDGRCQRGVGSAARPESARQSDESDTGHESTAQQGTECSDGDEPCGETVLETRKTIQQCSSLLWGPVCLTRLDSGERSR